MSVPAQERAKAESPEEVLTRLIALASSVDGIDVTVAAYEGFTYAVNARNPDYEAAADELAAIASAYLQAFRQRIPGGEIAARVALGEYKGRAVLVADVGGGFTFIALGEYPGVSSLLDPVRRLVEGKPLRCPSCGVVLDVYTATCPSCGHTTPFTQPVCPFCGHVLNRKPCPNCGTMLSLSVSRVEAVKAAAEPSVGEKVAEEAAAPAEAERAAAAPITAGPNSLRRLKTMLKVIIGSSVAVIYFASAYLLGADMTAAALAGIVPLATVFALLLS
ncbi:hypothetical protein CF15_06905 [Pyrodictium occultum]|uniref:DZANK-type domain-containing protein n=1 Tax=Pyrodictium occultum TaxID=2309 RepID=A0A0V8RWM3_PYROC|nr:hypothetical protein [Pyrodictium occultum]KSW12447.1 hypothetical protein CF15_06905 [Pyrodictium occultum]